MSSRNSRDSLLPHLILGDAVNPTSCCMPEGMKAALKGIGGMQEEAQERLKTCAALNEHIMQSIDELRARMEEISQKLALMGTMEM